MKKKHCGLLVVIMSISISCSVEQEFIKPPKIKKVYVSCQQYIELEGDIIDVANHVLGACVDLQKNVVTVQREALRSVNDYVDSEKDCFLQHAGKVERTERYEQKMKTKRQLDRCLIDLMDAVQALRAS
jgi:hypothetical protein